MLLQILRWCYSLIPRSLFVSAQHAWLRNGGFRAHLSCHILRPVHNIESPWSVRVFAEQLYVLSIGKPLHLPVRSVVWIGQNCPARRQMQSASREKKNCCRTTNFSGPMEPPKSLRVRCGWCTTVWSKRGKSVFPCLMKTLKCRQVTHLTREPPRLAIWSTPCGSW